MSIKKILTNGCVYYTVLLTAFYTFGLLAENASQWIPTLRIAYALLIFSMGFSAVSTLVGSLRMGFAPRLAIHFVVSAILFYLSFVLGGDFVSNGGSALAAMLCYIFVYAVGALIVVMLRYLFSDIVQKRDAEKGRSREAQKPEEYQPMFQKKK